MRPTLNNSRLKQSRSDCSPGRGAVATPRLRGFGLIDVIVGIALMLVLFLALFGVLRASLMLSAIAKANAAAVEVASTQMEYLRGLSYDSLGTVGGIPSGPVPQLATSTVDGVVYVTRATSNITTTPLTAPARMTRTALPLIIKWGR